jgi:competence protein ComEA
MHEDDTVDDDLLPHRPPPPLTWRDVADRIVPPEGAARLRAVATVLLLVVAGVVTWWVLRPPRAPATELSLPFAPGAPGSSTASSATTTTAGDVVVHAAGAVVAPGLHRLPAGSRVADLLAAAGGPAGDADLDRVNLAAPVADGERVWFPRVGEEAPPTVAGPSRSGASGTGEPAVVDLNTATAADLEALPGVGPSIAAAIVEHRERSGPFGSVDELLDVPGIGPARLEELRPFVTV